MNKLPIPASLWARLAEFIVPGRFGRIEIDVIDGKVVAMRLVESVKPTQEDERIGGMAA